MTTTNDRSKPPQAGDHSADRSQHRFGNGYESMVHGREAGAGSDREPGQERPGYEHEEIDLKESKQESSHDIQQNVARWPDVPSGSASPSVVGVDELRKRPGDTNHAYPRIVDGSFGAIVPQTRIPIPRCSTSVDPE